MFGALVLSRRSLLGRARPLRKLAWPARLSRAVCVHFFEGYTTLLCIVTLFAVMLFSKCTDWNAVWQKKPRPSAC